MQKDQSQVELQLKKQARRRLVGAIALVLLMIIFLPMLLKDRAASGQKEKITITLPSDAAAPKVAPSDFDSNIVPSESAQTTTAEVGAVADVEHTDEAAQADVRPPVQVPAEKATPAPKPVVKQPIQSKAAQPTATALKYYVQIGVYSEIANVKQLQSKLNGLGYQSQTEKIKTDKGEKIRLRTHLFNNRNEAAIALENIKDAGLTGMVVSQK